MDVVGELLGLPTSYGRPSQVVRWAAVEQQLMVATTYWLATTRPDGRPHAVPVDGIWQGDALYFGGDPATVHIRNLQADPRAVVHTEEGKSPVIAEGVAVWHHPGADEAGQLAAATRTKYCYDVSAAAYTGGTWRFEPQVVLAWTLLYEDATRFRLA